MPRVFDSHRLMDGCGELPTFVVGGYLHGPEITESAKFLESAKGHVHDFLIPLLCISYLSLARAS